MRLTRVLSRGDFKLADLAPVLTLYDQIVFDSYSSEEITLFHVCVGLA